VARNGAFIDRDLATTAASHGTREFGAVRLQGHRDLLRSPAPLDLASPLAVNRALGGQGDNPYDERTHRPQTNVPLHTSLPAVVIEFPPDGLTLTFFTYM